MKKTILYLLLFMISVQLYANENLKIVTLPRSWYEIDYQYDFRYINQLINEKKSSKEINQAYLSAISTVDYDQAMVNFIKYIQQARTLVSNNQTSWIFDSPQKLYNTVKKALENNQNLLNYFPPIICVGLWESEGATLTRDQFLSEIHFNKEKLSISKLIQSNNDYYVFEVKGYNLSGTDKEEINYFCISQIQSPLYKNINNRFELSLILTSHDEITLEEQKNFSFISLATEENILYGKKEHNIGYNTNDTYISTVNGLRVRDQNNIKDSKVIASLKKDQKVRIIEIGQYEVINGVPGNWLKIFIDQNTKGWCFGAYLKKYINEDEMF